MLPFEQPFFQGDVFHLPSFVQVFKVVLSEWILHASFPYLSFYATFALEDAL
jgi:hypothetical protein